MVKEILEFIFQDFWHFIGTCILLAIIFDRPLVMIQSLKNSKINSNEDKSKADKQ